MRMYMHTHTRSNAQVVDEDPLISAMHARAEKFCDEAEHAFGYLQVRGTVACCAVLRCGVLGGAVRLGAGC
jgi:hypothetical protein